MMTTDSEVVRLLRELVDLTRIVAGPAASDLLRLDFFDGDSLRVDRAKAYMHFDGKRSQREVAERAGVSQASVSRWRNEWQRKGLVNPDGAAVFNLSDFFPDVEKEINGAA